MGCVGIDVSFFKILNTYKKFKKYIYEHTSLIVN